MKLLIMILFFVTVGAPPISGNPRLGADAPPLERAQAPADVGRLPASECFVTCAPGAVCPAVCAPVLIGPNEPCPVGLVCVREVEQIVKEALAMKEANAAARPVTAGPPGD